MNTFNVSGRSAQLWSLRRWKNRDYTTCPSDYIANLAIWVFCGNIGVILQKLTVSIPHAYRRRSSPEEAPWKQKSRFWKSQFFKFPRPTHRKFCPERNFQPSLLWNFLRLYTLVHTLSNALSMIFIRHLYRAVSGFKPTCKNALFQNSSVWHFQKTHPTQEEFRHHKIIFVFRNYTVNNNFPDPKKEIS